MGKQDSTLTESLRSNAAAMMRWRNISPASLSRRMAALGFDGWRHYKTAVRFLNPTPEARKSISPDELMGLALALDTTVDVLLTGDLEAQGIGGYIVGDFNISTRDAKLRTYNEVANSIPRSSSTHGVLWEEDTPFSHPTHTSLEEGLAQIRDMLISAGVTTPEKLDALSVDEIGALIADYLGTLTPQGEEA